MTNLKVRSISKSFNNNLILKQISITFLKGQKSLLLGANGTGKSTFLKILASTLPSDSGDIQIDNEFVFSDQKNLREKIVYIKSREIGLYPHLSIKENINIFSKACKQDIELVNNKIKIWQSIPVFNKALETKFNECSKGMKQIALIFVQILHNPKIILLDEPFSGFDEENKNELYKVFDKQFQENIIIIASHDKNSLFYKNYSHIYLEGGTIVN